ncbi:MAG: hypothetical protein A3B37_02520 [Candidatus Sungbacteria bacterium RIFCSPLOWO2_01_FULL_59_16]|uniref:Uncharacterized protein n=1 Tax=Candidatus Sungbacteria bacterium RIFCSPLOWO2_01_FULL_59_16 TaxID=1802280 RepID=A0A1G2LF06_9BACT|nr:MAG: hypothetical protein A3B37_02520 [Candidatus Sungbacteria bacterium RIFCSPLOWO2_01_FULL_59_16]
MSGRSQYYYLLTGPRDATDAADSNKKGEIAMEQVRQVPMSHSVHEFPVRRGNTVSRVVRIEVENETGDVRVTTTSDVTIVRPFTIAGRYLHDHQIQEHLGSPVVIEPDGGFVINIRGALQEITMRIGQQVWPVHPTVRNEDFIIRLAQCVNPPRFDFSAGYPQDIIKRIGSQLLLHVTPLEGH